MTDTPTSPSEPTTPDDRAQPTPWPDVEPGAAPASVSPADMVKAVETQLEGKHGELKRLTAEHQRIAGQIKVVKDEIAEHERFLRAWKPRKSPVKKAAAGPAAKPLKP